MIPFPGESLSVDSFVNVSGTPITSVSDVKVRAGVSFFATGDAAIVRVFFSFNYLESADTPGEVAWAVEVSGGGGDLTLTECLGDGTPDVPLGTFTVAAGDTLVVPSSAITVADVYDLFYGSLLIEGTSGYVHVQQVKLRVFPVGGPLGGWGDDLHPSWERTSEAVARAVSRQDGAEIEGTPELRWGTETPTPISAGWENTLALMPDAHDFDEGGVDSIPIPVSLNEYVPTTTVEGINVTLHAESFSLPSPGKSGGSCLINGTGFVAYRAPSSPDVNPAEGLVDGVDYIANPYEIYGEAGGFATADTNPDNTWVEEYLYEGVTYTLGELLTFDDPTSNDPPRLYYLMGALPWAPEVTDIGTGTIANLWPDKAAVPAIDLTLPDVDEVLIAPTHVWFRADLAPPTPGVPDPNLYSETRYNGWSWNFVTPLQYRTAMPAYRVWNVNAPRKRKLRQLHRDDGLGGTPPRAFGGASRNRTQRAYGYT